MGRMIARVTTASAVRPDAAKCSGVVASELNDKDSQSVVLDELT